MKGEKRYWGVFLRTLAAFLAVWLLMAVILTVRNRESNLGTLYQKLDQGIEMLADNVQIVLDGGAADEKKPAMIADRLYTMSVFQGADLCVYRVYDDQMNELGRSPISYGSFSLPGTFLYSHHILFDPVLTDEEQIALAHCLKEDNYRLQKFYGSAYYEWGTAPNMGLYGEVTGILDEDACTIIPQKLIYCYEDHELILVDSDHEMFDEAELTTLRFDSAQIWSALSWDGDPEKLLELYKQAQVGVDRMVAGRTSIGGSSNHRYNDWMGRFSSEKGIGVARATAYLPRTVMVHGLGFTYVATLLAAILAAVWISHIQIRTLKRERRFTRAVAHDIKTPAAVLRAYAEALHEGTTPERQQEYLESMMEESDRMAVMVNELLALSRMEGAQAAILEEQVDLTGLVLKSFERLSVSFRERGLTRVEVNLQPVAIKGDHKRLSQAIDNLAANVLHHAKPGPVEVTLKQEKKRVVLTVENQCDPIPEEVLKHLWEPFYKVDESRSTNGSGLGLAVVKNVVTLHGGTCSARTTADRIEFRIELPMAAG